MPRTHIVQSWVGACEFDEGDTYSGEQIGNRNQKSIGVLIERSGDQWKTGGVSQEIPTFINGRANVSAFADPSTKPKAAAKKKSAFEVVCTADRTYEKLCSLSEELDQQLESGELSFSDWSYARKQLDKKLDRAWTNICKLRGWDEEGNEQLTFDCQEWQAVPKPVDYSIIPESSAFKGLSDNNVFKKIFKNALTAACAVRKILDVSKNILEDGLV